MKILFLLLLSSQLLAQEVGVFYSPTYKGIEYTQKLPLGKVYGLMSIGYAKVNASVIVPFGTIEDTSNRIHVGLGLGIEKIGAVSFTVTNTSELEYIKNDRYRGDSFISTVRYTYFSKYGSLAIGMSSIKFSDVYKVNSYLIGISIPLIKSKPKRKLYCPTY